MTVARHCACELSWFKIKCEMRSNGRTVGHENMLQG